MAFQEKLRAAAGWLVVALVPLAALAYWPALAAPFSAVKMALLFWVAGLGAAALFLSGVSLRLPAPQEWVTAAWIYLLLQVVCGIASPHEYFGAAALAPLLAAVVIAALVSWAGRERALLAAIGASATVAALVVLAQAGWGADVFAPFGYRMVGSGVMRLSGTFGNPDFAATFLAASAPALLAGAVAAARSWLRVGSALGLAACGAAVALTGFRGGVLALAAGLVLVVVVLAEGRKRWIAGLAVALALGALFLPASLHKRSLGEALEGRAFIWRAALPESAREWALGAGPNTFAYTYPARAGSEVQRHPSLVRFAGNEQHAENDFVEALNETGLPGLAALIAFFVLWFGAAWRVARSGETQHAASLPMTRAAALGGMGALATAACFDFPLHRPETLALLAIWAALPFPVELAADARARSWGVRATVAAVLVVAAGWAGLGRIGASYHLRAGRNLEADGAYRTAADEYERALRWDLASGEAHFNLARALAGSGQFTAALEETNTTRRYMDEPALWILRYRIQHAMGKDALPELRAAAAKFPYSQALAREVEAADSGAAPRAR